MRSIMRHAMRPDCTTDAVDDLNVIASVEVAELCRATMNDALPQAEQSRAWLTLKNKHGLSLCRFYERAGATHFLMSDRVVFLLKF